MVENWSEHTLCSEQDVNSLRLVLHVHTCVRYCAHVRVKVWKEDLHHSVRIAWFPLFRQMLAFPFCYQRIRVIDWYRTERAFQQIQKMLLQ